MVIIEVSGGLGNQMFGYAFAKALALKNKDELYISKRLLKNDNLRKFGLDRFSLNTKAKYVEKSPLISLIHSYRYYLKKITASAGIKFKNDNSVTVNDTLLKKGYLTIPYTKGKINIYRGLYQSSKYFDEYRDELIKDFTVTQPLSEYESEIEKEIRSSESFALHIRRGDYVTSAVHNICDLNYYKKAVETALKEKPNALFFVFSDDIDWVKENLKLSNAVYVDKTNNEFSDIHLMMNCKNFIISNSTFSWWAQYLSQNEEKTVIAPNVWLNGENVKENSIFMDNFICIDVLNRE